MRLEAVPEKGEIGKNVYTSAWLAPGKVASSCLQCSARIGDCEGKIDQFAQNQPEGGGCYGEFVTTL